MDTKLDSPYPADKYMADVVRWTIRQMHRHNLRTLRDRIKSKKGKPSISQGET